MTIKLRNGAEGAFQIACSCLDHSFSIHVYGKGKSGWCTASYRLSGHSLDTGMRSLPKGEWPTLLHLIERCGFWSLPDDGAHLPDPGMTVEDGEMLLIAGREAARYHRLHRYVWWEPGLNGVLAFGRRVSGFFAKHPMYGWGLPSVTELYSLPHAVDTNQGDATDGEA